MLSVRLTGPVRSSAVIDGAVALPVANAPDGEPCLAADGGLEAAVIGEATALLADAEHPATVGTVQVLPRPGRTPHKLYLFGVEPKDPSVSRPAHDGTGAPSEDPASAWRTAGGTLVRKAKREPSLTVALPPHAQPAVVRGFTEGLLLGTYRYRYADPLAAADAGAAADPLAAADEHGEDDGDDDGRRRLNSLVLTGPDPADSADALERATTVAERVWFARDLTNTPSNRKSPDWLAGQVAEAAANVAGLETVVWDAERLAAEGFAAVLAVGRGSRHHPRLVQLSWAPPAAETHVVLVGKGITFDTGGISIKPREAMKLMRKDMGGAAAVLAATLAAAALRLPVRISALAPLAENAVGADAFRPGDVVRHRGGTTSEINNTDAEGRLVLADALAYAAETLRPDFLVDLATLTGAQHVALGKRTAALLTEDDELAASLAAAATAAGERLWRLPLVDDYVDELRSDVADVVNSGRGTAGCITAALYLREFVGEARPRWAHLDMSAPAWSENAAGELTKGATGWGVRTLVHWLERLSRA